MNSVLWSGPQIKSERGWLPTYHLATNAKVDTPCLGGQKGSTQGPSKASLLMSSKQPIAPSGAMKVKDPRVNFQLSSSLTYACDFSSNRILPTRSWATSKGSKGWRDGLAIKRTHCSSGGPTFVSQHLRLVTHTLPPRCQLRLSLASAGTGTHMHRHTESKIRFGVREMFRSCPAFAEDLTLSPSTHLVIHKCP